MSRLKKKIELATDNTDHKVSSLARAIHEAGGRALLVGGCVRDALMGAQPKDWDLEVYKLDAARLRQILDEFGPVNVVGESFTVYKLGNDLDVSIPRRERKFIAALAPAHKIVASLDQRRDIAGFFDISIDAALKALK